MFDRFRRFGYEGILFVIPNGRNLAQYSRCQNADPGSKEILPTYISFISGRKNQVFLIEAFRFLPPRYRLQIVGVPLHPAYLDGLKQVVHRAGLDERVVFTGEISHREIPGLLERTQVLVSASKMEVQSLVVIEALGSGTPVEGLSNETVNELVDDTVGCRLPKEATAAEFTRSVPIRTWVFTSLSGAGSMAVQLDRTRRAMFLKRKHKGSTGKLTMPNGGLKGVDD